ncbi:pseudouridine synthase [Sphingobacterium hungaricum]|uniref:Pseudouridine synthase n=1 Tax=Sphingobacterium hungaricum TaxID=2082723 RepID=A0A928UWN7_9SPHI|nr:pseudouridine synthase [Sphingobacterium hungaricum]MBE8714610.1 pseudouridylate synthase [Sphingobacterium hungaricum]
MPFSNNRNSREDNSKKSRSNSENFKSKGGRDRQSNSSSSGKSDFSDKKSYSKSSNSERPFSKSKFDKTEKSEKSPFAKFERRSKSESGQKPPFEKSRSGRRSDDTSSEGKRFDKNKSFKKFDDKPGDRKPFDKNRSPRKFDDKPGDRKPFDKTRSPRKFEGEKVGRKVDESTAENKKFSPKRRFTQTRNPASATANDDGLIRLNRYISNAGICSRRKADELIAAGVISVNGEAVTELGTKVDPAKDEIRYNDERLKREKMVYVLLNKPKDYITTTDDPLERKTVMQLVAKATKERIYPVGRLDRNTTGLLLLTNDGNLAEKLSHPRNNISKIYNVELDKSLSQGDFNKIQFGIELEDGLIKPDDISYVAGGSKREVGIQIHSGKNRIVRRIFESLGYDVVKLDRVVYANLTKKDLPRGRWRYLEERELVQLKHFIK